MLNWRALPVRLAATLAAGLPPDSRSRMVLAGETITLENTLRALIVDQLNRLEWRMCDGRAETRPKSLLAALRGEPDEADSGSVQSFDSPEDFEAAMAAIEGGGMNGD